MIHSNGLRLTTKTLVVASFFVGINIILSRMGAIMLFQNSVRLSFGNVPLLLSGLMLGPAAGFMTGVVSDVLGFFINSHGGAYHPGFTLSAGLTGLIPGLVVLWTGHHHHFPTLRNVVLANALVYLLISGLLNTYWLTHLLGTGFWILLPARLVSHGIIALVNTILVYALLKSFHRSNVIPSESFLSSGSHSAY